jgi:non-specific serine/threonine protein kinase
VTSFVGRENEIRVLKDLLSDAPLVTLTGSGGVGKTRLAIRVAADLLHNYVDGVWLAELAAVSDPRLVPKVVATALSAPEHPGRPQVDTLVDALRFKSALLILDNCEHLVTSCAELSEALLSACAGVRIMATTREPLHIRGEAIFRVPSLSVPDPARLPSLEQLLSYESVRLFVDRASLGQIGFELKEGNVAAVARIVHGLDGIPLAIELAAARTKSLTISAIAERLDDRLRLLTSGRQAGLTRHQTLRAALDWSHDLLTDREAMLFRRLSVFAGSFTLEATEQICKGDELEKDDVLDLLTHLVDKSLVTFSAPEGGGRYRLLETIGQYGYEKLKESGEADRVQRRHRDWYLALAEKAEPEMRAASQAEWLEYLEAEHDNFRRALAWCISSGEQESGLRLASGLWWFWDVRGYHREGRDWLENTLRRNGSASPFRVRGLHGVGFFAVRRKDVTAARAAFGEALALSRTIGDRSSIAVSLFGLGRTAMLEQAHERAISFFDEACPLFEAVGDKSRMAWVSNCLGLIAARQGNFAKARGLYLEGLALGMAVADKWIVGYLTGNLGVLAFNESSYEAAKSYYRDALAIYLQLGARLAMIASIEDIGLVSAALGHAERAARLLGAAEAQGELLGIRPPVDPTNRSLPDCLLRLRATLGEAVATERLAEGRVMSLDQAVAYALAETGT